MLETDNCLHKFVPPPTSFLVCVVLGRYHIILQLLLIISVSEELFLLGNFRKLNEICSVLILYMGYMKISTYIVM